MRFLIGLSSLVLAFPCWGDLITNGDFESVREDGWTYRGTNDGSHGVFSEPTRPGTHSYLLQLMDAEKPGFSSISQKVAIEPGKTYQLSLEIYDGAPVTSKAALKHSAFLDGSLIFENNPRLGYPETGWYRRQATFRATRPEAEILIRLSGTAPREESTTLVDNVRLVEIDLNLPPPFLRGKPLKPGIEDGKMAVAIGYAKPEGGLATGYEPLERHRGFTGEYPPLCYCSGGWDPKLEDLKSFDRLIPKIQPWVELGVVPIVLANSPFAKIHEIGNRQHDDYFRAWARQARLWGYPLMLRPWSGMDRQANLNSGAFVKAWRRIHDIFEAEDARNVLWYWTARELSGESRRFYPGDSLVDLVGCDGTDPTRIYQEHVANTQKVDFAFSGDFPPEQSPYWLTATPVQVLERFPKVWFYSYLNLEAVERNSAQAEAYAKFVANPLAKHRLDQASPPNITATLFRENNSMAVAMENSGGPNAQRQSKLKVQFWSADPRLAGSGDREAIGRPHWVTLDQGEKRTIRQYWSGTDSAKFYVSIDRSIDAAFMSGIADSDDVIVLSEPTE